LLPGEHVETKGRGVALQSLPPPWPKVVEFVKQYFTCEGRYQVVYQHDFVLLNHLRHGRLINMPYYLLGCLKNMAHYTVNAKHQLLSLKHHRLVQLLINRGFSLHNPPPLNNSPQQAKENPQQVEENFQQSEENSQQATENQQPAAEIPQLSTKNLQRTPSLNKVEPSTPIVHIPTNDSDDNTPIIFLKRKKQQKAATPLKRRTRASVKEATISDNPPTLRKNDCKRKTIVFPASLPRQ